MKYIFTTLAIGESYLENASKCYTEYSNKCSADFNITTNQLYSVGDKVNLDLINLERYNDDKPGFSFYLNLKVLSLKYCLDKGYDYIIFNDADWRITDKFSEAKIFDLFNHMERNQIDFVFERPAKIGEHKKILKIVFSQKSYMIIMFLNTTSGMKHMWLMNNFWYSKIIGSLDILLGNGRNFYGIQ